MEAFGSIHLKEEEKECAERTPGSTTCDQVTSAAAIW